MEKTMASSEDLHLQVEEYIYQVDEENLLSLATHLELDTDQFVGKTKRFRVKVIRNDIEGRLEATESEEDKIAFLNVLLKKIKNEDVDEVGETGDSPKVPEHDPEVLAAKKELEEMQKKI